MIFRAVLTDMLSKTSLEKTKYFLQHGETSVYDHSTHVAYVSYKIALKINATKNLESLIIGALFHDYFLYDWHDKKKETRFHGVMHPYRAYKNISSEIEIDDISKDIILKHMFPLTLLPPLYIESWIVTVADKWCAIKEILRIKPVSII